MLERVWQRGEFNDQVTLPMSTGTAKLKENFVVLHWPQGLDGTGSEVHLFSTEGGIPLV